MRALVTAVLALFSMSAFAQVPSGTPIKLMILKDIDSSGSKLGDVVPFVVASDIVVADEVLISEGSMVFGKISQVRREGALSAPVFDKPARLTVRLEHMRDSAGRLVQLCRRPGKATEVEIPITREMTKSSLTPEEAKGIQMAWSSPESRPVIQKVRDLFRKEGDTLAEKEAEVLIKHNVQLPFVQGAIRAGMFPHVADMIRSFRRGRYVEGLAHLTPLGRTGLVAFKAFRELGRLSAGLPRYIEGRFSGRNIHCSAGTEITVYAG